jgi:hypothetical protein
VSHIFFSSFFLLFFDESGSSSKSIFNSSPISSSKIFLVYSTSGFLIKVFSVAITSEGSSILTDLLSLIEDFSKIL